MESAYDLKISAVQPGSGAEAVGIKAGDQFLSINGRIIRSAGTLWEAQQEPASAQGWKLVVLRGGSQVTLDAPAGKTLTEHLTGVALDVDWTLVHHTPFQQFGASIKMTFETLIGLLHPRGDISLSNMSGPIGIGRGFWAAAKSDFPIRFGLWFAVLVNINLAIFNLLPIPVLDGGHMLFATISRLRRRALPESFIMTTQSAFMVLLFGMIIYVSFFDSRRWVRDAREESRATEQREAAPADKK